MYQGIARFCNIVSYPYNFFENREGVGGRLQNDAKWERMGKMGGDGDREDDRCQYC